MPETINTVLGLLLRRVRAAGPAGAAVLVIVLAGVLVAVLPIPGTSCPASLRSLVSRSTPLPVAKPPAADAAKEAAEIEAISQAQTAVDAGEGRVKSAQNVLDDAQAAADSAQEASYAAPNEDVDSTDVDGAQWDVDNAQNSVDTDQDLLDMDTQYSYETADDAASLAKDQKTLAAAKTALKTAKEAAATAQAKATARAKAIKKAQAKAAAAQDKAQRDLDTANLDQVDLEATLSSAQNVKIAGDAGLAVVLAVWSHAHGQAVDAIVARNALRSSCRRTAGGTLAVSGVLVLVAVLLAAGNVVAVRRTGLRSF